MKKRKVLLVYTNYSTFVERDFLLLQKHFDVDKYHFTPSKKLIQLSKSLIKQFLYFLINIRKYNKFIIWFADYHSFIPIIFSKVFRKKSFIIVGGYDVTGIPQIKYGIFYSNKLRKTLNKLSLKYSDFLLPVDKSLILNKNNYIDKTMLPVGIKSIVKNIKGKIIELPTAYNPDFWKRDLHIIRDKSVICVAGIKDERTWMLKGGDLLLEIAKITPQINFHFYGINDAFINKLNKEYIPDNFYLHGYVDNNKLPQIYSQHKVYAQFSLSEGLPNSLCEAMLCECIPVGSNVNGIPNAIGDNRFILKIKNVENAKKIIIDAINSDELLGIEFRNKIINNYSENKRSDIMIKLLKN